MDAGIKNLTIISSGDSKKEQLAKERALVYCSELQHAGIDPGRLEYGSVYIPAYHQLVERMRKFYADKDVVNPIIDQNGKKRDSNLSSATDILS